MKNLYKYLPPFLADTFGFQEIVDTTDGMGILDDCAPYKGRVSRTDINEPYRGSRMVCSSIRMEDVIGGTKSKLVDAFRKHHRSYDPAFVLISNAPVSSMIGTDLEDVTDTITAESGIPAACVDLAGHKYYDHGLSQTMLALAKLLVKPTEETIPHSVNLIGGNAIDWSAQTLREIRSWITKRGFHIVSLWGGQERADNLKQAAKAELNLVLTVSGLATAKWMEQEFGIPYLAAAPFGTDWCARLRCAMCYPDQKDVLTLPEDTAEPHILIVGEQLTANAIRNTLQHAYKMGGTHVATFFTFEKSLSRPGDKRLKSEDDLKTMLHSGTYDLVIGDKELSVLAPESVRWVDLPHGAIRFDYEGEGFPSLIYSNLNFWLDSALAEKE